MLAGRFDLGESKFVLVGRRLALAAFWLSSCPLDGAFPCAPALAQELLPPRAEDNQPESFAEVDPYTGGEPAALERLGYEGYGPFRLAEGVSTQDAAETLGNVPLLWVETAHFRLGSSLKTYRPEGDREEAKKLEAELDRLRKRLGGLKLQRNQFDPWLRLHLYAQRLEDLYAAFSQTFSLAGVHFGPPAKNMGTGPYLGQKEKLVVLVLEKTSSLGRFTRRYCGSEQTLSYRAFLGTDCMFYGNAAESMREGELGLDAALHTYLAFGVVLAFCDGLRASWGSVPVWFKYGLGHRFARGVDPRWPLYEGAEAQITMRDDHWKWEPRVRGLVENGVFPTWEQMLAWRDHRDVDRQAHMIAWSRVDWLLSRPGGRPFEFLLAVSEPVIDATGSLSDEQRLARQLSGLDAAWGAGPAGLEKDWAAYVRKRYARK